jgi:hypothetical protein
MSRDLKVALQALQTLQTQPNSLLIFNQKKATHEAKKKRVATLK